MRFDSNYTLKFPRTSREAFGYDIGPFEGTDPNVTLWNTLIPVMTFLLGILIGWGL